MNGIVININPVIINLGALELRWYSLAIIMAIIAAVVITARQLKKKGIPIEEIQSLAPWMALGAILGARLFHVVDHWTYYVTNPLQIWQLQQGGMAIWGALIGGVVAAIIYGKVKHVSLGRLGDALVPGLLVGFIIGRIGCIINGDAYGGITNLPWGFIYTHPDALIPDRLLGVPTHPYPVYDMIWNASILVVVVRATRYLKKEGLTFLAFLSLYSVGRLVLSFVRQENTFFLGLQQAQIVAIFVLAFSVIAIICQFRKSRLTKEPTIEQHSTQEVTK
jgi:phosphatidylglycerol:prolipoprotein diacylglycerol transferase